ncbi:MAG: hypothetical protein AAGG38_00640 [Planctomycetota bacterium]
MQCNIDAKGKAIRLASGLFTLAAAALAAVLTATGLLPSWGWFLVVGAVLGGGFAVFEGWAGWCGLRAMGFKTPF